MPIIRLLVSNLLRVRAVEVNPDPSKPLVIVAGRNENGKSSVLNAITMAFSGKNLPEKPIHDGETKGEVLVDIGDYQIIRRFNAKGTTLEVRDREGAPVSAPQTKLDELFSRVTFDPLEFTRMQPADQVQTLKQIVGLDFTALDQEYAAKYAKRTEVGRQQKAQKGKVDAITRDPSAPAEEVSVSSLAIDLQEANEVNQMNAIARNAAARLSQNVEVAEHNLVTIDSQITELEKQIEENRALRGKWESTRQSYVAEHEKAVANAAALEDIDTAPIVQQMRNAESINVKVRDNARWSEERKTLLALDQEYQALTDRLEAITAEKEKQMGSAQFPIDGLGFDDSGVTLNGNPWKQGSSAQQIKASLAIACSLNPKLPVMLIREGSLLDDQSLKLVEEFAAEKGAQVWLEQVSSDGEGCSVFVEDGMSVEAPANRK
jgi:DNA repair exonuclease SbcCD ATPase subunit